MKNPKIVRIRATLYVKHGIRPAEAAYADQQEEDQVRIELGGDGPGRSVERHGALQSDVMRERQVEGEVVEIVLLQHEGGSMHDADQKELQHRAASRDRP